MRPAISAAPALVKVRQRMAEGSTPDSSSRSTRAVSTWVLPVPAEADRAAWAAGEEARSCSASSGVRGLRRCGIALTSPRPGGACEAPGSARDDGECNPGGEDDPVQRHRRPDRAGLEHRAGAGKAEREAGGEEPEGAG